VSYSLDIPADITLSMRDGARDASISAARTFGFGGSTWDYAEPLGSGTQPKVLTSVGTVQALAFRQRPGGLAAAAGGTPVLADIWRLIILDGTVKPGGVIVSQSDSDYAFELKSIEPWYQYRRAELFRRSAPAGVVGGSTRVTWSGATRVTHDGETRVTA